MRCARARRVALDVELGITGDGRRADVEAHVESCAACARQFSHDRQLARALRDLGLAAGPEVDVVARVAVRLARLPDRGGAPRGVPAAVKWVGGLATAALVATLVWGALHAARLDPGFEALVDLAAGSARVAASVGATGTRLLLAAAAVVGHVTGALAPPAAWAARLVPPAAGAFAVLVAVATATFIALARDLSGRPTAAPEEP
jgi:hypothetical protein